MGSGEPAEAGQEQSAEDAAGGEGEGAWQAFGGEAEPQINAGEDHGDQPKSDGVHGESPERGDEPVALVAGVVGTDSRKRMEEAQDAPGVEAGVLDGGAGGGFIESYLPVLAGADEAEREGGGAGAGGGPFDLAVEAELAHEIVGADEGVGGGGAGDGVGGLGHLAVGPEFGEGPGVVQQQAGEGEQPEEEEKVETEIVVRPAVGGAEGFRR